MFPVPVRVLQFQASRKWKAKQTADCDLPHADLIGEVLRIETTRLFGDVMPTALWRILLKAQAEPDAALTCDECMAILNCLAEEAVDEASLDAIWQAVSKHLARCPGCR